MEQFQQLMNMRNELKESSDVAERISKDQNKLSCFIEVNQWEQETIVRIREIADRVRSNITLLMAKNLEDIQTQLEQLSITMQQQQKEENYLENELLKIKVQLNELKNTIAHVNGKVHVVTSDHINWDTLIYVMQDQDLSEHDDYRNIVQIGQKDSINRATTNQQYNLDQSRFHSNNYIPFRPITPVNFVDNDSSSSERTSPISPNTVPVDRIVPLLPDSDQSFTRIRLARNRHHKS
ncbi:hypothetical protein I4U23_000878 [Adineta vaga]|nr:hypothetical protein I4U23_000878 [Adineta vaga]